MWLWISLADLVQRALAGIRRPASEDHPWMRLTGTVEGGPESSQSIDVVVYGRDRP
jgi:hypothetical protein